MELAPEFGRIQFTPLSTSNQLILVSSIAIGGAGNNNGGLQWRINGSASASFYKASTTSAYTGGPPPHRCMGDS